MNFISLKPGCSIAVIIPSYNYARFLPEAIESVLAQTVLPDEILITDDCSTDHTFAVAYAYHKRHPHLIRLNRNDRNLGIVAHFNKALGLTRSDYVCFLGADNMLPPNYLEATSSVLNRRDLIAIAYTDFELIGSRAKTVHEAYCDEWKRTTPDNRLMIEFPAFNDATRQLLYHNRNFIHGSSMFKRRACDAVGGYVEKSRMPEDYHLFLRMIDKGFEACKAPETFLYYRQHSEEQQNAKLGLTLQLEMAEGENRALKDENRYLREGVIDVLREERDAARRELSAIKGSLTWKLFRALTQLAVVRYIHRRMQGRAERVPVVTTQPVAPPPDLSTVPETDGPLLACVIFSMGNQPTLTAAVQSVLAQSADLEVVVVNSRGGDAAGTLKAAGVEVPVVERAHRLYPGAARNLGILATRAPYVAFLEGDCIAEPGWAEHRIRLHCAGAAAVATTWTTSNPENMWAWAAHIFLFARRLPGVPADRVLLYGLSYDRRLFEHYGVFREDLRVASDSEFDARIAPAHPVQWAPDIRATHHNPVTCRALWSDHFARGRRRALIERMLYGTPPWRIALNAWTRIPSQWLTAWKACSGRERRVIAAAAAALPWAATAYASGALLHGRRRTAPLPAPPSRLIALLVFHNEMDYLPDYFRNVAPHVDGVIALDDGSTDGSGEFVQAQPKVCEFIQRVPREPHIWDEPRNRRLLVEAAWSHDADWLLVLDADERLEEEFRSRADAEIARAVREGHLALSVLCRECWDGPDQYRVDGLWNEKRPVRLFRPRRDHRFDDSAFHGYWAPLNSRSNGKFPAADLIIYHLRMIQEAQRVARKDKYLRLDPESRFQPVGYEYLTDDTDLEIERCPSGRGYTPHPAPNAPPHNPVM